ncbi:MAG: endolytic transglycosylase MltG [Lachnospiraceae bacterium]|nr:endolytic transglycosylase MltG [Lachnospiraceae bacterium]
MKPQKKKSQEGAGTKKAAPKKDVSQKEASKKDASQKDAPKKKKKARLDYRLAAQNTISMSLRVLLVCVIIMIFYVGINRAYEIGYLVFSESRVSPKGTGVGVTFTIVEGQSAYAVGKSLKEKSLIEDPIAFYLQSEIYEAEIRPGTYEISSDMTSKEMLDLFSTEKAEPTPTPTPSGAQNPALPAQGQE